MIFLSAQPCDLYFHWMIEVQITNFRKFGLSDKMQVCVWYPEPRSEELKPWDNLRIKYPEVQFFYYKDFGVDLGLYIPQLRPHILQQHFKAFPALSSQCIFYHDSDIIFNYLPNFELLCANSTCWESDTSGYLDYAYLRRKELEGNVPEHEFVQALGDIGEVSVATIASYEGKTGGAQYVLKGIDSEFWQDVERMCIDIRKGFYHGYPGSLNAKYFKSEAAGLQSWCADMFAINFSLWKRGIKTDVTKELDFSWATDTYETYLQKPIMHNAGALKNMAGLFFKGDWIDKSPIGKKHKVDSKKASFAYVQAISAVK